MCYNVFVTSARFFRAFAPMAPRQAVLLTPSISLRFIHGVSSAQITHETPQVLFFVFKNLRTLSFSVSCKSCVCHSYAGNNILDKSNGLGYYLACEERHERQTKDTPTSHCSLRRPRQLPQLHGQAALAGRQSHLPSRWR